MIRCICQGIVALDTTDRTTELMNIIQNTTLGAIFLLITTCVLSAKENTGDRRKNSPTLENSNIEAKTISVVRTTHYHATDPDADTDTKADKTSTCIPISTVRKQGVDLAATNREIIPSGSLIIMRGLNGYERILLSADIGKDVTEGKAAKQLALAQKKGRRSPEYNAPVIDVYAKGLDHEWVYSVTILTYRGPSFKDMKLAEKIRHIHTMKDLYYANKTQLLASR